MKNCSPTCRSARVGLVAETGAVVEEPAEGLQSVSFEPIAEGAFCMPGEVSVDNTSSPDCTKLIVEASAALLLAISLFPACSGVKK